MNKRGKYSDIVGIILAGGSSSRMGTDKKLLTPNGIPQHQYLYNIMDEVFDRVYISINATEPFTTQQKIIRDQFDFRGPLNGILSSLQSNPGNAIFCLAVDMPNISKESIESLLQKRDRFCPATCYLNIKSNRLEPLFSIWEPSSQDLIQKFIDKGIHSPYEILSDESVRRIESSNLKIFENLNTPADLKNFGRNIL
ncbi:MAG: molybdenum cofactor guanylyltransferase [Bacteroidetes bacterium]|nr:molybdenum cofactor guanylyltransferase [Bacteroidota bacterium]